MFLTEETKKVLEKSLGISLEELDNLDFDEESEYLRIKRIEDKTKMSYNDFLKLDVLEQMKLYKELDLETHREKSRREFDEKVDSLGCPSGLEKKIDKKFERNMKFYKFKEKVKELVK